MNEKISVLISEEKIKKRVDELAAQLSECYSGETVTMLCTLKGAVVFTADLIRKLTLDTRLEFVRISSYDGTESTGKLKMKYPLECSVKGKHIIVTEDILDTGRTLKFLHEQLKAQEPASIKLVTLLDKPSRRDPAVTLEPEYVGFQIEDEFVVGYGLDYAEDYRNLPYIGVLKPEIYS